MAIKYKLLLFVERMIGIRIAFEVMFELHFCTTQWHTLDGL